jgi:hypothetical protein
MRCEITEYGDYVRAVIGRGAGLEDYLNFYRELQARCAQRGFDRAVVVVHDWVPGGDELLIDGLASFERAGFIDGFRLALVCATWTLYQACSEAQRAARQAGVQVRAFFEEMEGIRWLIGR